MPIHRIRDEASHREALREIERLWNAAPGTEERETVGVLADLVELYESRHYRVPDADPIEVLEFAISDMGRSQKELGVVLGSSSRASEVMNRRRALTIDMIDKPSLAHPGCSPGEALPARLRPKAQALPRTHASRAPSPGLTLSLRPAILDPLFAPATALPGVGPKIAPLLDRLLGEPGRPARIVDLLFHLPHGGISRELKGSIAEAPVGEPVTLTVRVTAHRPRPPRRGKAPLPHPRRGRDRRHHCSSSSTPIRGASQALLPRRASALRLGQDRDLGRHAPDGPSRPHPRRAPHRRPAGGRGGLRADRGALVAARRQVRRRGARARAGAARMAGPGLARRRRRFPAFGEALLAAPSPGLPPPTSRPRPPPRAPPRRRLAYDELLASQLALALVRSRMRRLPGRGNAGDGRLAASDRGRPALRAHRRAGAGASTEIRRDLAADKRMLRLLQGDVGSGKTAGRAARHGERGRGRARRRR